MKVHYSSQCVMGIKTDKEINRVEQSPEIDTHICGQLIFDKNEKQDSLFK